MFTCDIPGYAMPFVRVYLGLCMQINVGSISIRKRLCKVGRMRIVRLRSRGAEVNTNMVTIQMIRLNLSHVHMQIVVVAVIPVSYISFFLYSLV